MIFPNLILEDVVALNDKTRLDATKSFISKDNVAITLVEIEAETGSGFVTVGGPGNSKDWYLDWQYSAAGTKTVSCRITAGGTTTITSTLVVPTDTVDNLFSSDSDLTALDSDILKYIPSGRSSFKNVHRKAQRLILAWLDENGHTDTNGDRLTAAAIINKEEVKSWSAALVLSLIYSGLSNQVGDIFGENAKQFASMAASHRSRLILRLDTSGDGVIAQGEGVNVISLDMVRR
jgi:hypothetical protein